MRTYGETYCMKSQYLEYSVSCDCSIKRLRFLVDWPLVNLQTLVDRIICNREVIIEVFRRQ